MSVCGTEEVGGISAKVPSPLFAISTSTSFAAGHSNSKEIKRGRRRRGMEQRHERRREASAPRPPHTHLQPGMHTNTHTNSYAEVCARAEGSGSQTNTNFPREYDISLLSCNRFSNPTIWCLLMILSIGGETRLTNVGAICAVRNKRNAKASN